MKKKVLFLAFNYPNGLFGASTNCTLRIMKKLCESDRYEVHCISYEGKGENVYEVVPGIVLHRLSIKARKKELPRWTKQIRFLFKNSIYPFDNIISKYRLYRAVIKLINNEHYDLVVCHCNPQKGLWVGTLLKKQGYIDKLLVIFWDNIYGKLPGRVIPKWFALRHQRWAEGIVAKYADRLVSLYPIKAFHDEFGEIPQAVGKRSYLGIPSVIEPQVSQCSQKQEAIVDGKINILYSGTIFRDSYVKYLVDLFNAIPQAENINLIFFQKGVSSDIWDDLRNKFRGSLFISGWIPLPDLLALYPQVDFFVSFPGNPTAICSKLFEYVSFGKPIVILYDDDVDVNIKTFSSYPACHCADVRCSVSGNSLALAQYVELNNGCSIPYEVTEQLFLKDSPKAYLELIDEMLK